MATASSKIVRRLAARRFYHMQHKPRSPFITAVENYVTEPGKENLEGLKGHKFPSLPFTFNTLCVERDALSSKERELRLHFSKELELVYKERELRELELVYKERELNLVYMEQLQERDLQEHVSKKLELQEELEVVYKERKVVSKELEVVSKERELVSKEREVVSKEFNRLEKQVNRLEELRAHDRVELLKLKGLNNTWGLMKCMQERLAVLAEVSSKGCKAWEAILQANPSLGSCIEKCTRISAKDYEQQAAHCYTIYNVLSQHVDAGKELAALQAAKGKILFQRGPMSPQQVQIVMCIGKVAGIDIDEDLSTRSMQN